MYKFGVKYNLYVLHFDNVENPQVKVKFIAIISLSQVQVRFNFVLYTSMCSTMDGVLLRVFKFILQLWNVKATSKGRVSTEANSVVSFLASA